MVEQGATFLQLRLQLMSAGWHMHWAEYECWGWW